jgi:peptidoglycan L-alanyl-D-glutamate endopeptidase CwlK
MKHYIFSSRSRANLRGVKPEIVAVTFLALKLSWFDFVVINGRRSIEEQQYYFDAGVSKTMNSKHLVQTDGFAHAVDIIPCGFKTFNDITEEAWVNINIAMKAAGDKLNYPIHNGFDLWNWDKPHWQDSK